MSNKQSRISPAQQLAQAMRENGNVHVIPTKAAKIVKEMEKQIENLFAELVKSKSEVSKLSDLVEYQRDRIRALEEANQSKNKTETPKVSKNSDLAKPKKSRAKKPKKTSRVKKSSQKT